MKMPLFHRKYKYEKLNRAKKEIRVFSIGPLQDQYPARLDGLRLYIQHVSLAAGPTSEPPRYNAFSYAWSKKKSFKKVFIGGPRTREQTFEIPEDVYDMLAYFCHFNARNLQNMQKFWVDQICINQTDTSEKKYQVGMMAEIYKQAFNVLVWLGPPSDDIAGAISLINNHDAELFTKMIAAKKQADANQPVDPVNSVYLDEGWWVGLRKLLRRDWWSRTWIIQEALLPEQGRVYFRCGNSETNMTNLYHLLKRYSYSDKESALLPPYVRHAFRGIPFLQIIMRDAMFPASGGAPIDQLMAAASTAGCSMPRDRIFALLSLATEADRKGIEVDYDSTDEVVLLQAFPHIIRQRGLSVLQLGKLSKTDNFGLPSWVPELGTVLSSGEWFCRYDRKAWAADGTVLSWKGLGLPAWELQSDAPPTRNVRFSNDSRILACRGIAFDTIHSATSTTIYSDEEVEKLVMDIGVVERDRTNALILKLREVVAQHGGKSPYEAPQTVFAHTFIASRYGPEQAKLRLPKPKNSTPSSSKPPPTGEEARKLALLRLAGMVEKWTLPSETLEGRVQAKHWFLDTWTVRHNRTFIVTKEGYLGLGPPGAVPGDLVCVLHGAQVPFVLRKASVRDRHWTFVGDSFIHGIMDGEIFGWAKTNGKRAEEFWLC